MFRFQKISGKLVLTFSRKFEGFGESSIGYPVQNMEGVQEEVAKFQQFSNTSSLSEL